MKVLRQLRITEQLILGSKGHLGDIQLNLLPKARPTSILDLVAQDIVWSKLQYEDFAITLGPAPLLGDNNGELFSFLIQVTAS